MTSRTTQQGREHPAHSSSQIYFHVRAILPESLFPGEFGPGSLTAFGTTISFAGVNGPPAYDAALRALFFPLTTEAIRFEPLAEPLSRSAAIHSAAWAVLLTEAPFATLAEAEDPGSIALLLDPGLESALPGTQGGNIALGKSTILSSPSRTTVYASAASNSRAVQILSAWFENRADRRSTFELRRPVPFPFSFSQLASGAQAVVTGGELTLHIDPPMRASGTRLESHIPVLHLMERDAAGTRLTLVGSQPTDPMHRFALALSNALLTVAEPTLLELFATLETPDDMQSGALNFSLPQRTR